MHFQCQLFAFMIVRFHTLVHFEIILQCKKIDKNQQIELLERVAEKLNDDLEGKSANSQIIFELKSELESLKSEAWKFEKFQRNGRLFTYILAHILLLLVPIIQLSFQKDPKGFDVNYYRVLKTKISFTAVEPMTILESRKMQQLILTLSIERLKR